MPIFEPLNLETQTAKTASFTAEAGMLYPVNLGSVTADLVLTFPSSPNTDDVFGVFVSAVHSSGGTSTNFADRPFFCIEPANGTSINGSSYGAVAGEGGAEYSLWVTGEQLTFMYTGSTWLIVSDGRIKHKVVAKKTALQTVTTGVVTNVTYPSEDLDNANLHSTSTNSHRITIKRSGTYFCTALFTWGTGASGLRLGVIRDQASVSIGVNRQTTTGDKDEATPNGVAVFVPGNYAQCVAYHTLGSNLDLTASGNIFSLFEQ